MHLLVEIHEARHRAYEQTRTDSEAAALLGISRGAFFQWRRSKGLPRKAGPCLPHIEQERRQAVYEQTRTDEEAAQLIGITAGGFRRWRESVGLPAKQPRSLGLDELEVLHAWDAGRCDKDAADSLGCSNKVVSAWRRRYNVPPKHGRPRARLDQMPSEAHRRRWHAYCLHPSAIEAAGRLGISVSSMQRWQRRHDLPTKPGPKRRFIVAAAARGDRIALHACRQRRWMRALDAAQGGHHG